MTPAANETLKLQVGEVYTIALAHATGKPVRSQFTAEEIRAMVEAELNDDDAEGDAR
jgi:hypothetical protein